MDEQIVLAVAPAGPGDGDKGDDSGDVAEAVLVPDEPQEANSDHNHNGNGNGKGPLAAHAPAHEPEEEEVILISSDEETNEAQPMVPAPPNRPRNRKGVQVVHFPAATVSPKLEPRRIITLNPDTTISILNGGVRTITSQGNRGDSAGGGGEEVEVIEVETITLSSSDDEDGDGSNRFPALAAPTLSMASSVETVRAHTSSGSDGDVAEVIFSGSDNNSDLSRHSNIARTTDCWTVIETFLKVAKMKISFKDYPRLKKKFKKCYDRLPSDSEPEIFEELASRVVLVTQYIRDHPELHKNIWNLISQLLAQFNVDVLKSEEPFALKFSAEETKKIEAKKDSYIKKLEKQMVTISQKIKELDTEEVNWDTEDEENSSYLLRDRYMEKLYKTYQTICKVMKCSKLTGRPIQKAINLRNTTKYPEIELAVMDHINSNGYIENPDFVEVLQVVRYSSVESGLHLDEDDIHLLAKTLHRHAIEIRQKLRKRDALFAFPPECDIERLPPDPADESPELAAALASNKLRERKVEQIIEEFVEKQEEENKKNSTNFRNKKEQNENDGDGCSTSELTNEETLNHVFGGDTGASQETAHNSNANEESPENEDDCESLSEESDDEEEEDLDEDEGDESVVVPDSLLNTGGDEEDAWNEPLYEDDEDDNGSIIDEEITSTPPTVSVGSEESKITNSGCSSPPKENVPSTSASTLAEQEPGTSSGIENLTTSSTFENNPDPDNEEDPPTKKLKTDTDNLEPLV